jgi:hypothetical protein
LFDAHGIIVAIRDLVDKPTRQEMPTDSLDSISSLSATDAVGEISTSIASRLGAYLHLVASTHVETVVRLTLRTLDNN